MDSLKVLELFSGYGGASWGLKKANIPFSVVGFSEIDPGAIKCYSQNFNNTNFLGDITKINPKNLEDFDLLTAGFPCQTFSVAGKREGMRDPRGKLILDVFRIIGEKNPRFLLLENVKGLLNHEGGETFRFIVDELKNLGYTVYSILLNSFNYGVPQKRERVYFMCFRDIEDYNSFMLNSPSFENHTFRDLTEFIDHDLNDDSLKLSDNLFRSTKKHERPLITKNSDSEGVFYEIREATKKGFSIAREGDSFNYSVPNSNTRRGRVGLNCIKTLDTGCYQAVIVNGVPRRLSPNECFRLMGFMPNQIDLDNLSLSQKYKLAGNGWDINLISIIFSKMLGGVLK